MTKNTKNTKKGFYGCVNQKRKVKEGAMAPVEQGCKTGNKDEEKDGTLNDIFASGFSDSLSLHISQVEGL